MSPDNIFMDIFWIKVFPPFLTLIAMYGALLETLRIQKWLSQIGLLSRREAEQLIQLGKVCVNGKKITDMGVKIDPDNDRVTVNGKSVGNKLPVKVYWLLNKPDMTLTSRVSEGEKMSIFELPCLATLKFRVSSAGRLDYRSEGLLILSNDVQMMNRLIHPQYKVSRQYNVLANGKLTRDQIRDIRRGITLEDGPVKKIEIKHLLGQSLGQSKGSWYTVKVYEGRNRLVRRIFEHFDLKVVRLIRVGFGDLTLPENLDPGEYVQLKADQIKYLKQITGLT